MTNAPHPIRMDPDALHLERLELDQAAFQSPLPVQHYALVFEDEAIGLAVGIWDTTTMQEAFGPYPGDEYITVLDGSFAMVDAAGGTLAAAKAGDSVTFRNGVPGSWTQDGYLRKIYLTLHDPATGSLDIGSSPGGFHVLNPGRAPQGAADAEGVTRDVIFRNYFDTMTVTLCGFPAMTRPEAASPDHRLIRVLRGGITLTEPGIPPESFDSGAHLFLPKGTNCACAFAAGTVAVIVDVTARR